jgi:phosphohistidine phosphatase
MKGGDMDLILWRHAEAEDGVPDSRRKLTARGEKQAQKVASWLKKHLPEDARILSSPAVRAVQTAQALGLPFEEVKELGTAASAAGLLAAAGWPQAGGSVVVVGHQPTLGRVAARLLAGEEADWNIKKGAVWLFSRRGSETILRAVSGPDL